MRVRKNLFDIPSAANAAGFPLRYFRRIIEEDHIPVRRIGSRSFILACDFETWKSSRGEARLQWAIQQIDRWISEDRHYAALEHAGAESVAE